MLGVHVRGQQFLGGSRCVNPGELGAGLRTNLNVADDSPPHLDFLRQSLCPALPPQAQCASVGRHEGGRRVVGVGQGGHLLDAHALDLLQHGPVDGQNGSGPRLPRQLDLGLELLVRRESGRLEGHRGALEHQLSLLFGLRGGGGPPGPSVRGEEGGDLPPRARVVDRAELGGERPPHEPAVNPAQVPHGVFQTPGADDCEAQVDHGVHHGVPERRSGAVREVADGPVRLDQVQHLAGPRRRVLQPQALLLEPRPEQAFRQVVQRLALDDGPQDYLHGLGLGGPGRVGRRRLSPLPAGDPEHVADGESPDLRLDPGHEELGPDVVRLPLPLVHEEDDAPVAVLVQGGRQLLGPHHGPIVGLPLGRGLGRLGLELGLGPGPGPGPGGIAAAPGPLPLAEGQCRSRSRSLGRGWPRPPIPPQRLRGLPSAAGGLPRSDAGDDLGEEGPYAGERLRLLHGPHRPGRLGERRHAPLEDLGVVRRVGVPGLLCHGPEVVQGGLVGGVLGSLGAV